MCQIWYNRNQETLALKGLLTLNTEPTTSADAIAQKFANLFFVYGGVLPQEQMFVGLTLSNHPAPKVYMVRRDMPEQFANVFDKTIEHCLRDDLTVTGIGFMDSLDDSAICISQDNFLNKCDALIMPIDNEGEPDCQIVSIIGNYSHVPEQVRDFRDMHLRMWENLRNLDILQVAA